MSLKIVQSEDRDITVQLKDGDGNLLDLTPYVGGGAADITACFLNSGTAVTASLNGGSIVAANPICGNIVISLTELQTPNLDTSGKDFEVILDDGTKTRIIQLKGVLEVVEKLC